MTQLLDDAGKPGWMKIGLRPRPTGAIAAKAQSGPATPTLSDALRIAARSLAGMRVTTDTSKEEESSVLSLFHEETSEE